MPKKYQVTKENALEIREAMSKKENARYYRKLLAVALRGESCPFRGQDFLSYVGN